MFDLMDKSETGWIDKIWTVASQLSQMTTASSVFRHSLKRAVDPESVISEQGQRFGLNENTVNHILEKPEPNAFSEEEMNELVQFYKYLIELRRSAEKEYICGEV